MTYKELLDQARENILNCKACPVCNGLGCGNTMPGPGSKAPGNGANDNWKAWQSIRLNMDVFAPDGPVDTSCTLFGKTLTMPVLTGPIGSLTQYSKTDVTIPFNDGVIRGSAEFGIVDCFGDGLAPGVLEAGLASLAKYNAAAIPVINPVSMDKIKEEMDLVNASDAMAVAVVVDSAGLSIWSGGGFGSKTVDQIKELKAHAKKPLIIKGVLTAKNALQAVEAGADGIIVSNHGGRVLPYAAATAEVLPEIVAAVSGKTKIIVDGGIRSGADILKALAMGADAVMICRPFATAWFGADAEGVKLVANKLHGELKEAMYMCGARSLADISAEMVRL